MATLEPISESITQELYKRNAELAVRNKTLSLLGKLYEISILTLTPGHLSERITQAIQIEFNFDLVGIFGYDASRDELAPLYLAKSQRFQDVLGAAVGTFDAIRITDASQSVVFAPIFAGSHMGHTENLTDIWDGFIAGGLLAKAKEDVHIRTVLFSPLMVEDRRILGVLMIGLNRGYQDLSEFEQESIHNFVNVIAIALGKALLYQELQVTNQKLAKTNIALEKMDALKSEFVSMAGHQLRAPMTVIKGYISMVLDGTIKGATPAVRNALGIAMFSTEQLVKLVSSLLDLSRIESGKIKYDKAEGDLAKIAREVLDKFEAGAAKKGVVLVFENHAEGKIKFSFDQDKIREAVVNYVDNAIKYSSEGGRVVAALDIVGSGADARARLSVRDTGLGIKREDIAKLFDKFSRTDEAKNFDPNGMGIGLYFAKRVVQDHGGRVWAESEGIGRGSTFFFELPLARQENANRGGVSGG